MIRRRRGFVLSGSLADWVPDYQLGSAAVLARAHELLAETAEMLGDFQLQPGAGLVLAHIPVGQRMETFLHDIEPFPAALSIVAGEAFVALRTALEHAVYAEVEQRDGPLQVQAGRLVEMPCYLSSKSFDDWLKRRSKNGPPSLSDPSSPLLKRILSLQPFRSAGPSDEHPLARLVAYTNHAKHRAPALMAVRISDIRLSDGSEADSRMFPPRGAGPVVRGEMLSSVPLGDSPQISMALEVGINAPWSDRWYSLAEELDGLSGWVRTVALPQIILGDEPLPADMPSHFDIRQTQTSVRDAFNAGTTRSALRNLSDRVNAPRAREWLSGLIGQEFPGLPKALRDGWALSLSDQEVVAHASDFSALQDLPPGEILRIGRARIATWANEAVHLGVHPGPGEDPDGFTIVPS